ncbi:MAG: IS21 family transposase [Chloroflexi bacterium]|nr:IS21 family transposase [Chloroflexota bacterium]
MELFEEIRREYEFGIGTIQGVARKLGVHRRLVREALTTAVPTKKLSEPRSRPRIAPVAGFIDAILEADRQAPRKQRHTAHRIFERLGQERSEHPIAESTVRQYVRERKAALGLLARETFVPQSYPWGSEAQVDWYEAVADLGDERVKLQVLSMRSMASGGAFHRAYRHATQQAFLEAHELGFRYFGGVFRRARYDNLGAAVKRVLRGSRREETARFVAFRSHWRFQSEFCTPAEGHEKGGIENEVGRFRRSHWVPIPRARDLEELNRSLLAACQQDEVRTIAGREQSVGTGMLIERAHLLPLAEEAFDLVEVSFPVVTSLGCVKVKTNAYSVPVKAGATVEARLGAATVEVWHGGQRVAQHERSYRRHQEILDLEHYLAVLERKPGALAGSKPLEQWRRQGRWPESYDRFGQALIERQGRQAGTKAMIEVLHLGQVHGPAKLREAIDAALVLGCHDAAAVRHLLTGAQLAHARPVAVEIGALAQFERPLPTVSEYDQLLMAVPAGVSR